MLPNWSGFVYAITHNNGNDSIQDAICLMLISLFCFLPSISLSIDKTAENHESPQRTRKRQSVSDQGVTGITRVDDPGECVVADRGSGAYEEPGRNTGGVRPSGGATKPGEDGGGDGGDPEGSIASGGD